MTTRILAASQRDGRISTNDLALEVGFFPSLRRLRTLEDTGVIRRHPAIGPIRSWLASRLLRMYLACNPMFGVCDALLRVVAGDLEDSRQFLAHQLGPAKGVRRDQSEIPSTVVTSA